MTKCLRNKAGNIAFLATDAGLLDQATAIATGRGQASVNQTGQPRLDNLVKSCPFALKGPAFI